MGRKSIWDDQPAEELAAPAAPVTAPAATTALEQMRLAQSVARRDRREREPVQTYYGIPGQVHEAVKSLAADLGVPVGDVVRLFFERGLAAQAAQGDVILARLEDGGRRTLFPRDGQQGRAMQAGRGGRRKKTPALKISYRGVPAAVAAEVESAATAAHVPVGEVARRLLEWGLAEAAAGRLEMVAYAVESRFSLYG